MAERTVEELLQIIEGLRAENARLNTELSQSGMLLEEQRTQTFKAVEREHTAKMEAVELQAQVVELEKGGVKEVIE